MTGNARDGWASFVAWGRSCRLEALENIQDALREHLAAVDDILHGTPEAEVREVEVVV
jgi:hypothetical protein